jgi:hypothetical protein
VSRRERLAFAAFYSVALVVGAGLGIRVMIDGYSPIPFADLWDQFPFIERGLRGEIDLSRLFAQHNEHRIPLARLQFLVDYGLFEGTNVFLFGAIAAASLLLAMVFAAAVWIDTGDRLLALGALSVAATATMSPAGIENLTWSFQVAFVQVFLFAALAILALVVAARSTTGSHRAVWTAVAAVAAVAATYSLANGLVVWPILVVLALFLELDRRLTAALAIVGALSIGSFLWHFEFSPRGNLSDPVGLVHFAAVYLGSVVWGAGSVPAALLGATGFVLFLVLCTLCWHARSGRSVAMPFGAGLAAFAVVTAAETAVGRLDLGGTTQALSSRYSIGSATFWLALLVGLVPPVRERARSSPLLPFAYLAGAAIVALFVAYRMLPADTYLPGVTLGRELTVVAYRSGVEDRSQRVPVGQAGPSVREALRWMETERLGPWAPGGMVDDMRVDGPRSQPARRCRGRIEATLPIDEGIRLEGWIDAPAGEATSRNLVVLDGAGGRIGLGLAGAYRPDARTSGASSDWRGFVAYAPGQPTSLDVVLLDEEGLDAVCRLAAEQAS